MCMHTYIYIYIYIYTHIHKNASARGVGVRVRQDLPEGGGPGEQRRAIILRSNSPRHTSGILTLNFRGASKHMMSILC